MSAKIKRNTTKSIAKTLNIICYIIGDPLITLFYCIFRLVATLVICTGKKYDVIIMEVVEENGMLCQSLFNDLILIRYSHQLSFDKFISCL